jgi:hypothetical protein
MLLTLEAAAKIVAPEGGITAETLRRLIKKELLAWYRPGKPYLVKIEDVREALAACRVAPKARICGNGLPAMTALEISPIAQSGLSLMEMSSAALDLALMPPETKKKRPSTHI